MTVGKFTILTVLSLHLLLALGSDSNVKDETVVRELDVKVEQENSKNEDVSQLSNTTTPSVAASVPSTASPEPPPPKKKRELRMSKLARHHLSDESNPNNFPKALGIDFPG